MTAKQCVVLGALRDAQHEHDGQAVGAYRIAAVCPVPWHRRPDLVTQALVLLQRDASSWSPLARRGRGRSPLPAG